MCQMKLRNLELQVVVKGQKQGKQINCSSSEDCSLQLSCLLGARGGTQGITENKNLFFKLEKEDNDLFDSSPDIIMLCMLYVIFIYCTVNTKIETY